MRRRSLRLVLALARPLGGCTAINARMGDGLPTEKLAAESPGIYHQARTLRPMTAAIRPSRIIEQPQDRL